MAASIFIDIFRVRHSVWQRRAIQAEQAFKQLE